MNTETELARQVGIVTGAGRGIGRAIALELAARGMKIAAAARSSEEIEETVRLIEAAGGEALAIRTDVTDRAAVERMVAQVLDRWHRIDFLVSNAGSNAGFGPAWEADPDRWWRDIEVNLRGPFLCARAVLPAMIERGSGRVVNVIGGIDRPIVNQSAYGSSKVGLVRFTETLAEEAAGKGIRVFAIGPGAVDTRLTRHVFESSEGRRWNAGPLRSALNWRGPEAAAGLVSFLASGKGDALSGRCVRVEDDAPRLVERIDEVIAAEAYVMRRRLLP